MGRIKQNKRELRRLRIAELLLAQPGLSHRAVARAIGCGVGTVHEDIAAIRAEWAARRAELYDARLAEDLSRTDAAIAAIWPGVLAGKAAAIDRLVSLLTYRARVLGLDTQRQELDLGELLASYLTRVRGEENAPALPAPAPGDALPAPAAPDGSPAPPPPPRAAPPTAPPTPGAVTVLPPPAPPAGVDGHPDAPMPAGSGAPAQAPPGHEHGTTDRRHEQDGLA